MLTGRHRCLAGMAGDRAREGGEGLLFMPLYLHVEGVDADLRRHDEPAIRRIGINGRWNQRGQA